MLIILNNVYIKNVENIGIPSLPKNLVEVIEAMNNHGIRIFEGESFLIHTNLVNNIIMCFSRQYSEDSKLV